MEPEFTLGIPPGQRLTAAQVLYDSLEEIRTIFGPRGRAVRVIAQSLAVKIVPLPSYLTTA